MSNQRIVLIGAGSAQFGFDMLGDFFQSEIIDGAHIVLHDIDEAALSRVYRAALTFIESEKLNFSVSATTNRQEALKNSSYCVIAIEVGDRFALWELDKSLPLQYGFNQVFGENGGPGGLFHALRVIPPILEICEDISKICPDAWVFNYSNPMSRICSTVVRRFPDLKFVGLCHEIASLYQHLPKILDTPLSNINFRAGGLNHFSILVEASYKDSSRDALADVLQQAASYFENLPDMGSIMQQLLAESAGSTPNSEPALRLGAKAWAERGVFKMLLEQFRVLPITTDSHIGEYIAWAQDSADHKGILDFYTYYKQWTLRQSPEIKKTRSERLIKIIEAMENDTTYEEAAVNIKNDGFIPSLPNSIVVEVPAIIDATGIHGITLPTMPVGFAGLLSNQVAVHELCTETVLQSSKALAVQALLVDPVVHIAKPVNELLDLAIARQQLYLDYLH